MRGTCVVIECRFLILLIHFGHWTDFWISKGPFVPLLLICLFPDLEGEELTFARCGRERPTPGTRQ